ncbi:MAG: hypothetical protein R3Y43_04545 [Alphaproteobacteria bacterium]
MNFIKNHWFGLLMSLLFASYLVVFITGLFSPQTFESCTEEMANKIMDCDGEIWCSAKVIMNNLLCEFKTVL